MKKSLGLCAFVLLSSLAVHAGTTVDPGNWRTVQLKDVVVADGAVTATATGSDPMLITKELAPFAAADNPILQFRMKYPEGKTTRAQLFWRAEGQKDFAEARSVNIPVTGSGEFALYRADLSAKAGWEGNIVALRFDPAAPAKDDNPQLSVSDFALVGLFEEIPLPAATWGSPFQVKNVKKVGETVSGEFEAGKNDPHVDASVIPFPADAHGTLTFELRLPPGAAPNGQLFWTSTEIKGFNEAMSTRFNVPADGEFHEVKLDLAIRPAWQGTITKIRLDMTNRPAPDGGQWAFRNMVIR